MLLRAERLGFSYRANVVLRNVSLELAPGELLVVLGPNGAGKSTLLRCLNGILKPNEGAVFFDGVPVESLHPRRLARHMAYVPQSSQANFMTVFDAVLLGRKPHFEWGPTEADLRIAAEALRVVGLQDLSLRRLNELSGGELQKVALARALAQQPRVLLLDEPTNNLDIKSQTDVMGVVRDVTHGGGVGSVVVTHDINLALRYGDKFIVMNEGTVWAQGGAEIVDASLIKAVYGMDVLIEEVRGFRFLIPEVRAGISAESVAAVAVRGAS